jgi:D-alanine-D-alanine ligase
MKVAVIYNRDSLKVINLLGMRNPEKYRIEAIKRITEALKSGGHQVKAIEGDKDLIDNLEHFMPAVVKGERPGMAFNLAYGIQGQARYTHVPAILEMVGLPYVGSGPLAHSLSLDKVVAKLMFLQNGLPTPDFAVLEGPGFERPDLQYPLIVKPKSGADSFGLKVVHDEDELREAAGVIFKEYEAAVLVERFIDGREINVGVIGNPPEAFPPVELDFAGGPNIFSNDDKGGRSERTVGYVCPAELGEELTTKAQNIACRAFTAVGCYDCARVDIRLDKEGNLYILELNSLPSLGYRGSYVVGAQKSGLEFPELVNRLVEIASARYFGTPTPAPMSGKGTSSQEATLKFLTERRDRIEKRVGELVAFSSRTADPIGTQMLIDNLDSQYADIGLRPVRELSDAHAFRTWETVKGMDNGTLFLVPLDVALGEHVPFQAFRRDPEWLYGEGIGTSRAPLVMLEFAMRALRFQRRLRQHRIGVLVYADEGQACRYSRAKIVAAASKAKQVVVLGPGSPSGKVITRRRGLRVYQLVVEGKPQAFRQVNKKTDVVRWVCNRIEAMSELSSRKDRLGVYAVDLESTRFSRLLPHRVKAKVLISYPDLHVADEVEQKVRALFGKGGPSAQLHLLSDRPPMPERKGNHQLLKKIEEAAATWDIPLGQETSASPSVAGLVPDGTAVICGLAPITGELYTPHEAVRRTSLLQHTLLLAQFLSQEAT